MENTQLIKEKDEIITQLQEQLSSALEQLDVCKHQLDWFKRQLFGRKSEKQLFQNPQQSSLFNAAPDQSQEAATPTSEVKSHKRSSKKKHADSDVNETGLRFDYSVPQEVIELSAPELDGDDRDSYEVVDIKETTRLAQRPGSYVVLRYRRPVVRHKQHQTLTTPAAPDNVLEGCYADVSVLAGLMVDKAVYHLPLYRQHQRILDNGIHISRSTLMNWMLKGIALLKPIYQAQWRHVLRSQILAMDEVPMKAGRKGHGKMQQTYFWPIYGENDEVVFTWSRSRGHQHAVDQLTGFSGTLLTDGYSAYDKAVDALNKKNQCVNHATCWAHSRRTFEKALNIEPESAKQALAIIADLYKVEKNAEKNSRPAKTFWPTDKNTANLSCNVFFVGFMSSDSGQIYARQTHSVKR